MKEVTLEIEGMHCEGCSSRLEKMLNNLEGVNFANVSLENKKAIIKYDENQITLDQIKQEIEDIGFSAK